MTLTIDRDGVTKTFSFQLERAAKVLRDNQPEGSNLGQVGLRSNGRLQLDV
jgi:hypothetical protein